VLAKEKEPVEKVAEVADEETTLVLMREWCRYVAQGGIVSIRVDCEDGATIGGGGDVACGLRTLASRAMLILKASARHSNDFGVHRSEAAKTLALQFSAAQHQTLNQNVSGSPLSHRQLLHIDRNNPFIQFHKSSHIQHNGNP
jgi:hypothetical protein